MCSGTTISNSLTELYNLLEYTRPQKLRELNIACFDQWARSYSKISREFEHKLDGSVKLFKRLRWFEKVPELSKLYNDICHYADEKTFDIGSPQVQQKAVIIKPSPAQKKHFQSIKNFLKTSNISCLPNYKNKMGDKNWKKRMETAKGLIAMTQGREASVDVRGLDIAYTEEDLNHCKAKYCADKVFEIYKKYEKHKGTQIIFSDMFTPTSKKFNIYKEIKELLVSKGIAKHQIQFIHDHNTEMKKENLLKAVNQGMVRVILGSTQKLGTGVNAQKRIVAMHNLDVPFRPSDVEQRLGRGARAGNELAKNLLQNKVPAYFYLVEESTDNYILNLVNIKNNFIKQFKQCNVLDRTFDTGDVDDDGKVNYAQLLKMTAKDSLLPDLIKVQSEIKQLEMEREAERKAHNRRKEAYENTKKTLQKVNTQKQYYENIKNKMQDENLSIQLGKNNFNIHKDTQKIGAFIQEKSKNLQEKLQKYTKTNAATFRQEGGNKTILLGKTSNEHLLILEPDLKTIQSDIKIEGKYVMKRKLELHLILKNPDEKEFTHKSGQVTKDKKDMGNYIVNAYNTTIQKHLEGYHKTKKQYEEYLKINQKYENDFAFEKENTIAEKRKQYQTLHAKLEGKKDMQEDMGMGM